MSDEEKQVFVNKILLKYTQCILLSENQAAVIERVRSGPLVKIFKEKVIPLNNDDTGKKIDGFFCGFVNLISACMTANFESVRLFMRNSLVEIEDENAEFNWHADALIPELMKSLSDRIPNGLTVFESIMCKLLKRLSEPNFLKKFVEFQCQKVFVKVLDHLEQPGDRKCCGRQ